MEILELNRTTTEVLKIHKMGSNSGDGGQEQSTENKPAASIQSKEKRETTGEQNSTSETGGTVPVSPSSCNWGPRGEEKDTGVENMGGNC